MKILVTGAAGFIGAATVRALLERDHNVVGLDNINSYYDTRLKYARLQTVGIAQADIHENRITTSLTHPKYRFIKMELSDRIALNALFESETFDIVINLAGQAGVRYSIENPFAYVESNVMGFLNVLECCRHHPVEHLIYASSSSVYGASDHESYAEADRTDTPVSLYAATKKSDELMAYAYSRLYHIPATGVRFFTVYGPWGRPDMAPYLFLHNVLENQPIRVFNHGQMERDFTYIDDIVGGLMHLLDHSPLAEPVPHKVYNIGRGKPVKLLDFIHIIEQTSGRKAQLHLEGMQKGDVYRTNADTSRLQHDLDYHPKVSVEEGVKHFYDWYRAFYQ